MVLQSVARIAYRAFWSKNTCPMRKCPVESKWGKTLFGLMSPTASWPWVLSSASPLNRGPSYSCVAKSSSILWHWMTFHKCNNPLALSVHQSDTWRVHLFSLSLRIGLLSKLATNSDDALCISVSFINLHSKSITKFQVSDDCREAITLDNVI